MTTQRLLRPCIRVKTCLPAGVVTCTTRHLKGVGATHASSAKECATTQGYAVVMAGRIHRNLGSLRPRRLLWNMYAIEKPRNVAI